MTGQNTNNLSDAIRNLIVCDTQFGWTGETTLKLPELLDLKARGWLIEGDENCEFSLTDEGQAVVARALQQDAPAELAEQQGDALIDAALGYLNTALDDLDSCPDRRPGIMVTEAMHTLREAIAARQPGAQVPEVEFQCRLMDVKTDLPTENWHHSPTYEENPGRGTHYWVQFRKRYIYYTPPAHGIDLHRLVPPEWLSEQLGGLIDDLTPGQAWRQGFNQCRARALLLAEQAMGFPSEQQRDAAPGVVISQGTHDPSGVANG